MNITQYHMGLHMQLHEGRSQVLVIENPHILVEFLQDVQRQSEGEKGILVLSEQEHIFSFSKTACLILEILTLSGNERKLLTKLYKEIEEVINEKFYEETVYLNAEILQYLDKVLLDVPYPITYDIDFNISAFLKMMHIGFDDYSSNILEKLVNYLKIISSITQIRVIFFFNLKSYLTKNELIILYKEAAYLKLQLVLIESVIRDRIENEDICIIDADSCIIQY